MPESTYAVNIIISTRDKTSAAAKTATKSLLSLQNAAKLVAVAYAAWRVAQKGIEFVKLGAQVQAAEHRLIRFAGGAAEAADYLDALSRGSDHTIDRMTGMIQASRMLSTHMVTNTAEMETAGAMVAKLGVQTWTTERRMSSLTMLLANQSIRRLDDFGLSVEAVRKRQQALEAQGISTEQAFKTAVFDEAREALGTLGDTSVLTATKIAALEGSWATLEQTVSKAVALLFTSGDALERLTNALIYADKYLRAVAESAEYTERSWLGLNAAAAATAGGIGVWQEDEENLRATLEEKTQALESATNATIRGTAATEYQIGAVRANWIAERDYIDALDGAMQSNTELAPSVFTVTTTLHDQAAAALSTSSAMLDLAMSYSAYLQQVSYASASYADSAADIEARYAERVAQIGKMGGGAGGGGAAPLRFFDEADLKRGLEIMRLQLAELEKTRKDWDKTQAEGEPVFWYELSREDRKYLMESGKTLEDLALEREKSGDDITDLERAQMDDRIEDLKREIKERKDLLKRGYYESHQIHVAAARVDTEALLAEAADRRDQDLINLQKSQANQELAHKQSLGRIRLAQFDAWVQMKLDSDTLSDEQKTTLLKNAGEYRKGIAIEYGLATQALYDETEAQTAAWDKMWFGDGGMVGLTQMAVADIIAAFDEIPKTKEINLKVIQEVHRKTATPGATVPTPTRQHGGPVKAGVPYLTHENELFVPGSSGHIYNQQQTRNISMGQNTYNFPDARAMAFLSARERAQSRRAFASASGM